MNYPLRAQYFRDIAVFINEASYFWRHEFLWEKKQQQSLQRASSRYDEKTPYYWTFLGNFSFCGQHSSVYLPLLPALHKGVITNAVGWKLQWISLILHIKYAYVKMKIENDSIMIGITVTCEICVILEDRWPGPPNLWKWKSSQGNFFPQFCCKLWRKLKLNSFLTDFLFQTKLGVERSPIRWKANVQSALIAFFTSCNPGWFFNFLC